LSLFSGKGTKFKGGSDKFEKTPLKICPFFLKKRQNLRGIQINLKKSPLKDVSFAQA